MYREVAKLILYRDLGEDSILLKLSGIFEDFETGCESKAGKRLMMLLRFLIKLQIRITLMLILQ